VALVVDDADGVVMIVYELTGEGSTPPERFFLDEQAALDYGRRHALEEFGSKYVGEWLPPEVGAGQPGVGRAYWILTVKPRRTESGKAYDARYFVRVHEVRESA
jgi:hypothetical protein